jgi:predicted nuclease of restriction endonuclease-like (RecB) superfamily
MRKPSRKTKPAKAGALAVVSSRAPAHESSFREVVSLIQRARQRAFQAVNTELIDLYWRVGQYISRKLEAAEWGEKVVGQLAQYIHHRMPNVRGFSRPNLFRMRAFFEAYRDDQIVSPLVRLLSWTMHLNLISRCKRPEEREFYMRLAVRERWGKRELERQLKTCLFERAVLSPPKVAAALRQSHPEAEDIFKDAYVLEFLDLPGGHREADLHRGLLANLKDFLIELGRDFCFVGSEYPVQVGLRDFSIDLLFFNRALNCLVAFDLKVRRFEPEHLGKMEFYLEALDRDVKKPHERPSIGILLCATKDNEVVEYALSRSASPTLIAEYQTALPDKQLLRRKLHEFYQLALPHAAPTPRKPDSGSHAKETAVPSRNKRKPARP